jgi:hypothetical protein
MEIEPACSGTEAKVIGNVVVVVVVIVVPVVGWEGTGSLMIFAESGLRVGIEGLEPSGELGACWCGWDIDCGHSGVEENGNTISVEMFVSCVIKLCRFLG